MRARGDGRDFKFPLANASMMAGGGFGVDCVGSNDFGYCFKSDVDDMAKDILKYTIKKEYGASTDKTSGITWIWDVIMPKQHSCIKLVRCW